MKILTLVKLKATSSEPGSRLESNSEVGSSGFYLWAPLLFCWVATLYFWLLRTGAYPPLCLGANAWLAFCVPLLSLVGPEAVLSLTPVYPACFLLLLFSYLPIVKAIGCLLFGVAFELRLFWCCNPAACRSVSCLGLEPTILLDRFQCSAVTGKNIFWSFGFDYLGNVYRLWNVLVELFSILMYGKYNNYLIYSSGLNN